MGNNEEIQEVVLIDLDEEDLGKVAEVHLSSFPDSAMSKLGSECLRRYYHWQLTGPHLFVSAKGAFVNDKCAGFLFGGKFVGSTSGFLKQNKFFLVKEVFMRPWLIFNSLFVNRLFYGVRILRRMGKRKSAPKQNIKKRPPSFGILAIGVSSDFQRLGIGKLLMVEAEKTALEQGFLYMHLTVDPKNENAIGFYEKLDWQKSLQDNSWKGAMIKKLH